VPGQEHAGHAIDCCRVHVPGGNGRDGGVAGGGVGGGAGQPAWLLCAGRRPGGFGLGCAGLIAQISQTHVQDDLGGLPGPGTIPAAMRRRHASSRAS
jgi:hypothetical protein